jgi:hypothetical protein
LSLPALCSISSDQLPEPWRGLLAHQSNMTPTLSAFWAGQRVDLVVLDKEERREVGELRRWIKLQVARNEHVDTEGASGDPSVAEPMDGCNHSSDSNGSASNSLSKRRPSSYVSAAQSGAAAIPSHVRTSSSDASPAKKPLASPKPGRMRFQESVAKTATPPVSPTAPADEFDDDTPWPVAQAAPSDAAAPSAAASIAPVAPTPVEFGSIRIHVHNLPPSLQPAIWAGAIPFATLLATHDPPVVQSCHPQMFFEMEWSAELARALDIRVHGATKVYGRCNTIRDAQERVICEVVEIMPPMQ